MKNRNAITRVCLLVTLATLCATAAAGDPQWRILKPSNTGVPGELVRFVRVAPDGRLWVGARWPFWQEGGLGVFDRDTETWTTLANWETPIPSPFVNDIEFANDGVVWIATDGGLVKKNGDSWTVYNTGNSPLLHNKIRSIDLDADGHVWINNSGVQTTNAAIFEFDGQNWTSYHVGAELPWPLPWVQLSDVIVDHAGHVWVANTVLNGVAEFDGQAWTLHGASAGRFGELMEDLDGNIWTRAGVGGGNAFWKFDHTQFTIYPIGTTPTSLGLGPDGAVYTGDWSGNIRKTTDAGETWSFFLTGLNQVFDITPDPNGEDFWIGTIGAVGHFYSNGAWVRDYNSYNSGLPDYFVDLMQTDRDGNFWVATGEAGLSRFDGQQWRNWGNHNAGAEPYPFAGNEPMGTAYQDSNGTHWFGGNGIARWDSEADQFTGFWNWENNPGMGVTLFTYFAEDVAGRLFAATKYGAVFHFDTEQQLWIHEPVQPNSMPGMQADSQGNVWIAGRFNLHKWDGNTWSTATQPNPNYFFNLGGMTCLAIGPDDTLWLGTNEGLVRWDGTTFDLHDTNNSPLPAMQVQGVDVRSDGLVALSAHEFGATTPFPSGIALIDGDPANANNWSVFPYGQTPVPHYQLGAVAFDPYGNVWISAISEGVAVLLTGLPGDSDGDGDVDLVDYNAYLACVTGPGGGSTFGCHPFDLDSDGDVDFADFRTLQFAFAGAP